MKTACIYHSVDLDGWMSAAIVKHWFLLLNYNHLNNYFTFDLSKENNPYDSSSAETMSFLGYNYGQPIPDLSEYDKVIMCDISFPKEEMEKIATKLIWIDHHISAIETMMYSEKFNSKVYNRFTQTNYAACELTWFNFFDEEPIPEIVRLLGRYDCFGHKGTSEENKVLEFQYGARQCISNYEEAFTELLCSLHNYPIASEIPILESGKAIYKYLCTEAKQVYKNGFPILLQERVTGFPNSIEFINRRFICFNKERFNPINFGIDYHKDGYDGAACFHYANGKWSFSIYNDNGLVDCSIIAKSLKGGGHKGASGFIVSDINEFFGKS